MLASEMIATIKHVEKNHHGINRMYASRINYFQSQNLPMTAESEYDFAFDEFIADMEAELGGKVNLPTAKKILNNWYLWAEGNLEQLSEFEPFISVSDCVEWLIKNNFRINHASFAREATEEQIKEAREKLPRDSSLLKELKEVADRTYPGPRGFNYDYLIKVVAGFSECWN